MRSIFVVVMVLVGCNRAREQAPTVAVPPVAKPATIVPKVATTIVLAVDGGEPPPFLVVLDAAGTVHLTAVATWPELATRDLLTDAKTGSLETIQKFVSWAADRGQPPRAALAEAR